jgi:hypothetical protein
MLIRICNAITIYSLIHDVNVGHTTVCIEFFISNKIFAQASGSGGSVVKSRCAIKRVPGSNPVMVTLFSRVQSLSFLIT